MTTAPENPAGEFQFIPAYSDSIRSELTNGIRSTPVEVRNAVAGLSDVQLDTLYRNWTIRQIAHHLADRHLHSLIRFQWTLAEDHATIKAAKKKTGLNSPIANRGTSPPLWRCLTDDMPSGCRSWNR
jgi:hypothetical protein